MIVDGDDYGLLAKDVKHDYQLFIELSLVVSLADIASNALNSLVRQLKKLAIGGTLSEEGKQLAKELARELEENDIFILETDASELLKASEGERCRDALRLIRYLNAVRNRLLLTD